MIYQVNLVLAGSVFLNFTEEERRRAKQRIMTRLWREKNKEKGKSLLTRLAPKLFIIPMYHER